MTNSAKRAMLAIALLATTGLAACGDDRPLITERTTTTTAAPQPALTSATGSTTTTTTLRRTP